MDKKFISLSQGENILRESKDSVPGRFKNE